MKMIEYVGIPGIGKSTRMNSDFPYYSRIVDKSGVKYLSIVRDAIFFKRLYGLKGYKRIFHSLRLVLQLSLSKELVLLDEGLFQLYLSNCATLSKKINREDLWDISERIERKYTEKQIIVLRCELSFEEINKRLKNRNRDRVEGISSSFYESYNSNLEDFVSWLVSTKVYEVKLI